MKKDKTARGFDFVKFKDRYGVNCTLQKSSIATEDCIWFGVDDAEPKIMASDAKKLGVETDETEGWVEYPIPKEVLLSTRMHLSVGQAKELIPILQKFVDTGEI